VEALLHDARYCLRSLAKTPSITAIVVATLGLGIGVNTAIFGLLNAWLFRPLPVRDSEQIVVLASQDHGGGSAISYPALVDLRRQADLFSDVFAYGLGIAGLSVEHKPHELAFSAVSGNYFSALGLKPAVGRLFLPGEGERPGEELLVVLGYSYWQKNFGGARSVEGKQVLLNGMPARIIGVAPKEFHGLLFSFDIDGYVPLNAMLSLVRVGDTHQYWSDRNDRVLTAVGRLKPKVTLRQAQSAVDVIAARMAAQYPATDSGTRIRVIPEWRARPAPSVSSFVPMIAGLFLVLPSLVLFLAGMNVANILLVRAMLREREMAIRAALGAARGRLIRLMLTESLILAIIGSIAGVVLGYWSVGASGALLHPVVTTSSDLGYRMDYSLDWRVLVYTALATALTAIIVGLWPALHAARADLSPTLHGGSAARFRRIGRLRLSGVLVVAQVAGSIILLIVAGLFVRSLLRAEHIFLGFDPARVLSVMITPRQIGFDDAHTDFFFRELEDRLRALPQVESVSMSETVPMGIGGSTSQIFVEGHSFVPSEHAPEISSNSVDPAYVPTMRVPLLEGRNFTDADNNKSTRVAIINRTMAHRLWPNENAIGKRFRMESEGAEPTEVVGIVADGQYLFVSPDPQPYFFVPLAQRYTPFRYVEVRSEVSPKLLVKEVEDRIHNLAPDLPIIDARSMQDTVHGLAGLFIIRLAAALAGAMGTLGLILAIVGIYGVVSYAAAHRTREIGVRMALGAERIDVLKLVFKEGVAPVVVGALIGILVAAIFTRAITKLLIGVSATDPLTYVVVVTSLSVVALLACWLPARRATHVDPMVALRSE